MTGAGVPIPDEARERAKQAAIRAFDGDELPTAEQVADLVLVAAAPLILAAALEDFEWAQRRAAAGRSGNAERELLFAADQAQAVAAELREAAK